MSNLTSMSVPDHMSAGVLLRWGAFWFYIDLCASFPFSSLMVHVTVLILCGQCTVRVSIGMKRHLGHSNSHKRKTFHWGGWLTVQKFHPLSSCWETAACRQTWYWRSSWQSCIWLAAGSGLRHWAVSWPHEISKPTSIVTFSLTKPHLLQQAIAPDSAAPFGRCFLSNQQCQQKKTEEDAQDTDEGNFCVSL